MQRWFFEAFNDFNWGKFMVGRFDAEDWAQPSGVDVGRPLLAGRGWGPEHLLVLDLQTGEGAVFCVRPGGVPHADLGKRKIWVCPLFEPFLEWLYVQDTSALDELSKLVELPSAPRAVSGYRRTGDV